jgi:predicted MPP superfamily phosphohydrolase
MQSVRREPRWTRRRFLRLSAGTAVAALLATGGSAVINERFHIQKTRREIGIPGLPDEFHGFRITHLTDLHHGRRVPIDLIEDAVDASNAFEPDLVVLTGDYVTGSARFAAPCAEALRRLRAPCGVLAVLGNHDHWAGTQTVIDALRAVKVDILQNEHRVFTRGGARLAVAGVDDLWTGGADGESAFAGLDPAVTRLLLTHNPDFVEEMPDLKIALALAGHTHGGQIGVPFLQGLAVPSRYGGKYAEGLVQGPTTRVYVNRGVGTVGISLRVFCRPEVALVVLRRPAATAAA